MTPFSAHCISDQKVRTVRAKVRVMVRVRVSVRVGDAVVRNAVGRKVGNHKIVLTIKLFILMTSFQSTSYTSEDE